MRTGGRPSVFDPRPWEPSGRPQLADQMVDHQPETYQTLGMVWLDDSIQGMCPSSKAL